MYVDTKTSKQGRAPPVAHYREPRPCPAQDRRDAVGIMTARLEQLERAEVEVRDQVEQLAAGLLVAQTVGSRMASKIEQKLDAAKEQLLDVTCVRRALAAHLATLVGGVDP